MMVESKLILMKQECGNEFEYRVLAVNKVSEDQSSNVIMTIL